MSVGNVACVNVLAAASASAAAAVEGRLGSVWVATCMVFHRQIKLFETGRQAISAGFCLRLRSIWGAKCVVFHLKLSILRLVGERIQQDFALG